MSFASCAERSRGHFSDACRHGTNPLGAPKLNGYESKDPSNGHSGDNTNLPYGEARRGEARRGEARRGEARRGEARRGEARRGLDRSAKLVRESAEFITTG